MHSSLQIILNTSVFCQVVRLAMDGSVHIIHQTLNTPQGLQDVQNTYIMHPS